MELIDRAALGVGRCSKDVLPAVYCAGWNGMLNIINDAPTIDAVPVVRCRECVNNIPDGNGNPYCRWLELYIKDLNFFCRDGQRKIETVLPINDTKDESLEDSHVRTD